MKFTITGRNINLTEGLKNQVEKKLGKLSKYFSPDTMVNVTLSVQKDVHTIEVTIPVKGGLIRAEEGSSDMYVSIDLVEEIIERQIRRHRKKLIDKTQSAESFSKLFAEEEPAAEEEEIRIVKVKKFDFKPMDPEEACLQMELLGHNFFVFKNAETDETCVVYKRKGDTYGLIEPEN
ncbi:MAG: ribosome-associated translation inhibitor RaiA [Eubacteriales bacterium]|nr:ribosome-associated translation inhibitor RaiA [Eubacteriales bacterium]